MERAFQDLRQQVVDVTRIAVFGSTIVFSDQKARQMKQFDPTQNTVTTLQGSGREGQTDATDKSCSFVQVQDICSIAKSLVVTDVAAGKIKVVSGLSGTVSFLKMLGCLYDTFGIHAKGQATETIILEDAKQKVNEINGYIRCTVAKVKERINLNPRSATNGPEGTVSSKTQKSLELLKKGLFRLVENIKSINP